MIGMFDVVVAWIGGLMIGYAIGWFAYRWLYTKLSTSGNLGK